VAGDCSGRVYLLSLELDDDKCYADGSRQGSSIGTLR
jgi:hypothetical protein